MDSQSSDVNALGDALHESLNIRVQVSEPASDGHEGEEDIHEWKATCPKKHLIKAETFPYPKLRLPPNSSSDEEGEEDEEPETVSQGLHSEESNDHAYSRSISLPTPLKLVSAMKGSRRTEGIPPKKLPVKWAPDVYDPRPTLMSHSVKNKSSQKYKNNKKNDKKNEKKNGKKGHKNSSHGISGKDKKQSRKAAKGSNEFEVFEVGSSNPHCGNSFLRKSHTEMHYPVAEAL
ncbi:hypothetical protein ACB092_09G008600 [Castanea dentata]